jgi:hypothetical protein
MGNELAIPYLEKEAIIAAVRRSSQYNALPRVSPLFRRVGHMAEKLTVRIRTRSASQVRHTTMDGEAVPVREGTLIERDYEPTWLKVFTSFGVKELTNYARAAEAKQMASPGPEGMGFIQKANEHIREMGQDLSLDLDAERERLCVDAVQSGTVTATLANGGTQTINYGLQALTAPSTKWDDAGAKIVTNMYAAIDEFKNNNPRGIAPNIVFYNPKLYKEAFVGNTEWKDFKKASPDLAAGFLRLARGTTGVATEANMEGYFTDPLFDLTWVPVDGTYKDLSGVAQSYWNYKNLTLARLDLAGFEWGQTIGHPYNPVAGVNVELQGPSRPDVQSWSVFAMDNGLPIIKEPELIQTWRVIT